ncbi:Oidioi.mRNA.OKI2018_I69.chr2.g4549.t1.cds [Oikopleura dioica]|uniref:Oidioi.mRNA.OKI2018_I69.chr2.g4549.t1.cds n=1 Tax=Oikopleura dioica TaxID=34765 RepID=A0ABN7T470_OIKDI|nr:Oidioi.mRNA.OKI2018_I69.chr2.g4549.t1.cds [Oikopleura dioica]
MQNFFFLAFLAIFLLALLLLKNTLKNRELTAFYKNFQTPEIGNKSDSLIKKLIFGHLIDFSRESGSTSAGFDWRRKCITETGAHVIRFFSRKMLVIYSPEIVQFFTNLDAELVEKSQNFKRIFNNLTSSVLFKEGKDWKADRKHFEPFCFYDMVKKYASYFYSGAQDLSTKLLDAGKSGKSVLVDQLVQELTLKTLMASLLGIELDLSEEESKQLNDDFITVSMTMKLDKSLGDILAKIPLLRRFSKKGQKEKAAFENLRNLVDQILDQAANTKKISDLAFYLQKKTKMTRDEIAANIFLFTMAGHETNKSSIVWALYELAKDPELQKQLVEEFNQKKALGIDILTYVQQESLLSSFVSEVQRFYSVAPEIVPRTLKRSVTMPNGLVAPKGTTFMLGIWESHMNPTSYFEPEKFNPRRFLDNDIAKNAFIPFSAGQRKCVGYKYGITQVRTVIATLLEKCEFKLDTAHHVNMTRVMTMNPHNGVKLFISPRKNDA